MLSSHLIADTERVCDHLVLLAASRVQLCGDTEALLAVLAVVLLVTGLHAAQVWHSALAGCAQGGSCASLAHSLSLASPSVYGLVVATAAVPLLPGLFWGAPMVAQEAETGTHQFAWTQSITRRRWLAVRAGWLLLGTAVLAGAVSALATWWSGPDNALHADAFRLGRFGVTGIVPVGYAVFAMALGICAGALLRRTVPAIAVMLAGFVALRAATSWLRLYYMTPVTVYYKLTADFAASGSYLPISHGVVGPDGRPITVGPGIVMVGPGQLIPAACRQAFASLSHSAFPSCVTAHGWRGYLTYQPAGRFWAFQGIEAGIYVVIAAALLAVTFWALKRWDA